MDRIILRPLFFMLAFLLPVAAASQERVLSLTTFGKSSSREAAINSAQKEAIQQSLSIFDSSTSRLLSDIIIQEGSAPSGIIKSSEVFSSATLPDSSSVVSLIAKISLDSLFTCAKTHEPDVQLPNEYVLKIKLREVKKKNEEIALMQVRKQVEALAQNMFSFDIKPDNNPKIDTICGEVGYVFVNDIVIKANRVSGYIHQLISSTLETISLTEDERQEYEASHTTYYSVIILERGPHDGYSGTQIMKYYSRLNPKQLKFLKDFVNDAFFSFSISTLSPLNITYSVDNQSRRSSYDGHYCYCCHINSGYSGFDSFSAFRDKYGYNGEYIYFALSTPRAQFESFFNEGNDYITIPFFSRYKAYSEPITTIQAAVFIKEKDLPLLNGFTVHRNPRRPPVNAIDLGIVLTKSDGSKYNLYWADRNLGASKPEETGDYYKWGEVVPLNEHHQVGHQLINSCGDEWQRYKHLDLARIYGWESHNVYYSLALKKYCNSFDRDAWAKGYYPDNKREFADYDYVDDAARVSLGKEWRVPTEQEIKALITQCSWKLDSINGVKGYRIISRINSNSIFLPFSDEYELSSLDANSDEVVSRSVGSAEYWSSSLYYPISEQQVISRAHSWYAIRLRINDDIDDQSPYLVGQERQYGALIRPVTIIKNEEEQ